MARKIRIYKIITVKGKRTLLAEFMLLDSGKIISKVLVKRFGMLLEKGVFNRPLKKKVFPSDGNDFMDALLTQFSGAYTRATEIKGGN